MDSEQVDFNAKLAKEGRKYYDVRQEEATGSEEKALDNPNQQDEGD